MKPICVYENNIMCTWAQDLFACMCYACVCFYICYSIFRPLTRHLVRGVQISIILKKGCTCFLIEHKIRAVNSVCGKGALNAPLTPSHLTGACLIFLRSVSMFFSADQSRSPGNLKLTPQCFTKTWKQN